MIPTHAKPRLQNQGRAEGARVIRRRADGVLGAGPAKPTAVVRAAIDAVGGGVENLGLLEAEAIRQSVLVVDVVVDLGVEGVRSLFAHLVEDEILRPKSRTGDVGGLEEGQELFGDGADAAGTYHVQDAIATDLLAAAAVRVARGRIVDFRRRFAEVAAEPFWVWNRKAINES